MWLCFRLGNLSGENLLPKTLFDTENERAMFLGRDVMGVERSINPTIRRAVAYVVLAVIIFSTLAYQGIKITGLRHETIALEEENERLKLQFASAMGYTAHSDLEHGPDYPNDPLEIKKPLGPGP